MLSANYSSLINPYLQTLIAAQTINEPTLQQALQYAVVLGGKRIRPQLCLASAELFDVPATHALAGACAVELVHCYSLIHDDLPCMDDDALRRGLATCHIQYGEATALLAGDYLQPMAMQLIASQKIDPSIVVKQLQILSHASCAMVDGQSLDLQAERQPITLPQLQGIHAYKTAALIEAALLIGASYATPSTTEYALLSTLAQSLGLAYQVQDDILDITSSTETLGKPAGSDLIHDKATYPKLLGLAGAQHKLVTLHQHIDSVIAEITQSIGSGSALSSLVNTILQRNY